MIWDSKLEENIRKVGDYVEMQMKDLVNPKTSAVATTVRMLFNAYAGGGSLMHKTCREAGYELHGPGFHGLQKLVDIAEDNGSDAAEKIKKVIAVEDAIAEAYRNNSAVRGKATPADILRRVKIAKQQNIQF